MRGDVAKLKVRRPNVDNNARGILERGGGPPQTDSGSAKGV